MKTIYLISYRTGEYINSIQIEEPKDVADYINLLQREYENVSIVITTIQI